MKTEMKLGFHTMKTEKNIIMQCTHKIVKREGEREGGIDSDSRGLMTQYHLCIIQVIRGS